MLIRTSWLPPTNTLRKSGIAVALALSATALLPHVHGQTAQIQPVPVRHVVIHLDPAKTTIAWVLHDSTHTVNGTFQLKGGLITFNEATGVADGEMLVDVTSGGSGNSTRDSRMKTQVLETQKYPTAFFHPTLVTGVIKPGSAQDLTVQGTLNIHGADHPMALKVKVTADAAGVGAKTQFEVPYVAWGMRDPSFLVFRVAKQVEVSVMAHGTMESAP